MQADGYFPASGAADVVGIAVCDIYDSGRKRLARLDLGLCVQRNEGQKKYNRRKTPLDKGHQYSQGNYKN
jgi:hypothetical protein